MLLLLPLGHISNSLPLALESIIQLHCDESNTHRVLVLIMFCLRERFGQRICDIQIRVYFTNFYVSILNIFTDGVEATLDVPSLLVKPGLLGKCNSSSVVTEEFDRPRRIGYDSEVGDELLHPNCFMRCLRGCHVLRFTCRSRHDALLATAPAYCPTIQNIHVSGL